MSDARVPLDPILDAFGVPATVTRPAPDDDPVATTALWPGRWPLEERHPFGTDLQRRDPRRVLGLPKADVPHLPKGTLVVAPEEAGGPTRTWMVDNYEQHQPADLWLVLVKRWQHDDPD